ncbi:hypothetical protein BH11ARM2_BH11ARM2_20130 [soil metagenome]
MKIQTFLATRQEGRRTSSPLLRVAITLLAALPLASLAGAAEGESVQLHFARADYPFLGFALLLGLLGLLYAAGLVSSVMKAETGTDEMRRVQGAIKDGALAYLRKQSRAMMVFGAVLFVALLGLNWSGGVPLAIAIAVAFACGAVGSYTAGYTGMVMAVNGNVRTAHAATQSYRRALEVAFRSGAVAGLVTVGIGLVGASVILMVGGPNAVRLLIGFGFGGSLAALFMRVGGGIFTKAADVGADLVGKVEAGIPEDDPRNPAVIADNVGDNVGDCAGMAADVFESYEVTLISAIVLAASTSAVFDTETWQKLVLFSMMSAGIGLAASIAGIGGLKGSDDLSSDPLVPIRKGFNRTAILGLVGTSILAFFFMGGFKSPLEASNLQSTQASRLADAHRFQEIRDALVARTYDVSAIQRVIDAKAKELNKSAKSLTVADIFGNPDKVDPALKGIPQAEVQHVIVGNTKRIQTYEITGADVIASPEGEKLGLEKNDEPNVNSLVALDLEREPTPTSFSSYTKVTDPNDPRFPQLQYATYAMGATDPSKAYTTVASSYMGTGEDRQVVMMVQVKVEIPARAATSTTPAIPGQKIDRTVPLGPAPEKQLKEQIKQQQDLVKQQNFKGDITILSTEPTAIYAGPNGSLALGIPGTVPAPYTLASTTGLSYFPATVSELEAMQKQAQAGTGSPLPPQKRIDLLVSDTHIVPWWRFVLAFTVGLALALAIEKLTEYYVSTHRRPTQEVAGVSSAGAAPMIIQGFAYACESSAMMAALIVVALLCPLFIFPAALYGGYALPLFGVALVGLGLLSTTGYVLAMDTFGPISDNAQGVYEMSGAAETNVKGAKIVSHLDAAGNTTKALTKGFAIATAVVASIALFHSYLDSTHLSALGLKLDVPEIFLGLLIGGAAPFLFSAFAINAVGRASFQLINEVRRQFREDPGIMAGTSRPDYARCVAIVTDSAQRELVGPGILAIALPVAVGFGFSLGKAPIQIDGGTYNITGAQALGGFLAGAILSGQLLAVLLANSGGMWDNAKKLIEDGNFGGKGSENHKASVICDTVGDPFKDTAGPALNPLIKVMNLVALLLAPVIIQPFGPVTLAIVTIVAVGALVFAIMNSKRGSFSDDLRQATEGAAATDAAAQIDPVLKPAKKKLTIED